MNKVDWISDLVKSIIISVVGLIAITYIILSPRCDKSMLSLPAIFTGVGLWWFGFLIGYGYEDDEDE